MLVFYLFRYRCGLGVYGGAAAACSTTIQGNICTYICTYINIYVCNDVCVYCTWLYRVHEYIFVVQDEEYLFFPLQLHNRTTSGDSLVGDDYNLPHWINHR